jgi:peptidyl-prolyl cis-trans isomerase B (cyclophilin B)
MTKVKISTEKGDMIAELYDKETPKTVQNFIKLISKKFYDGLSFHRVIPNFVIQGGDIINNDGSGVIILNLIINLIGIFNIWSTF